MTSLFGFDIWLGYLVSLFGFAIWLRNLKYRILRCGRPQTGGQKLRK
jgi:hypothetical protein